MGRRLLFVGGCLSLGVAVLHLAIVFVGPAAYRYFGAGERLASLAAAGSPVPAIVTLGLAAAFAIFGLYALSGADVLPRFLLLRTGLVVVGALYTLRGLLLLVEIRRVLQAPGSIPARELVFSAISLVIGLLYLGGTAAVGPGLAGRTRP